MFRAARLAMESGLGSGNAAEAEAFGSTGDGLEPGLKQPRDFQRRAQFYLDFVEAENSTGFHAPEEAGRILGESVNFARKGQLARRPLRSAAGATLAPAPVKGPSGNSTAAGSTSAGGTPRPASPAANGEQPR